MKRSVRTLALRAVAIASAIKLSGLSSALPVGAHNQPSPKQGPGSPAQIGWWRGDAVGRGCLEGPSNYGYSIQAILHASGILAPSDVDGWVGPRTGDAIQFYQYYRHLEQTGCAAGGTLNDMETFLRYNAFCDQGTPNLPLPTKQYTWDAGGPKITYVGVNFARVGTEIRWDGWRSVDHTVDTYIGGGCFK